MPEALKPQEHFGDTLQNLTKNYEEVFSDLQQHLRWTVWPRDMGKKPWGKLVDPELSLGYLRNTTKTVIASPISFKETQRDVKEVKRQLKQSLATPKDLSNFYRRLRGQGLVFGDIVEKAVHGIYDAQPRAEHSLMSQLLYLQALSRELFPEVPKPRDEVEALNNHFRDEASIKASKGNRNERVMRMLKQDFELLATAQIVSDNYDAAERETGERLRRETGIERPIRTAIGYWKGRLRGVPNPGYDLPALKNVSSYVSRLFKEGDYDFLKPNMDVAAFLMHCHMWLEIRDMQETIKYFSFSDENVAAIRSLPDVKWEENSFDRVVPSGMKTFFSESKNPLVVTVDPAPGKAYIATVSITPEELFKNLEGEKGSAETAREVLNPLASPFNMKSYVNVNSLAFYVKKDDGELVMYGDSKYIPRAALGKHYETCKKLVHHVVFNLTHAEYLPNWAPEGDPKIKEGPASFELERGIADKPTERLVPPEQALEGDSEKPFLGRAAHTRLLPSGWFPGYRGWTNARELSEALTLHAIVFDKESRKIPMERIALELKGDFKVFREQVEALYNKHGDNVRFQTCVSEKEAEAAESKG